MGTDLHPGTVLFLAAVLSALAAVHAADRECYVSPSGDDGASGSFEHPWKTVARAVKSAGPGVTVNVRAGEYREAVIIEKGGAQGRPFTLRSARGERAVLDGGFAIDTGIAISAPYVVVSGLEIRKYRIHGILIDGPRKPDGPGAHHILVEQNVIHHISSDFTGDGKSGARGIRTLAVSDCTIRRNTIYFVVGNNESFGIHFDIRSPRAVPLQNTVIEKNLFYFNDKSGARVVDNGWPFDKRCYVLATPAYLRQNISVHNGYVGLEVNYINSYLDEAIGPLGGKKAAPIYTEDNFVGWAGRHGLNPKESNDGISRHNTAYRNLDIGYLQNGRPSKGMRIEGNLIVDNPNGSVIHTEGTDNRFTGNYYRQVAPWLDFFVDRTRGWGTTYTDMSDLRGNSNQHPEKQGILNNRARLFVAPEKGDFRLRRRCPAVRTAPGGGNFGARESKLRDVGASGAYGLSNIPLLPEIRGLRVVAFSSEDRQQRPETDWYYYSRSRCVRKEDYATGLARHLVDGALSTVWRPAGGATTGWVVFELPGGKPVRLGAVMIRAKYHNYKDLWYRNVKECKLYVRTSMSGQWKEVGKYTRHKGGTGRFFEIEGSPEAKQVKFEVLSNHGADTLEVPEFKLYEAFEPFE